MLYAHIQYAALRHTNAQRVIMAPQPAAIPTAQNVRPTPLAPVAHRQHSSVIQAIQKVEPGALSARQMQHVMKTAT